MEKSKEKKLSPAEIKAIKADKTKQISQPIVTK